MENHNAVASVMNHYLGQVKALNFDHPEGGRYAYVKLLSITRDLLQMMQPVGALNTQVKDIQSINWLINQHLVMKFGDQQRVIFESKRAELTTIIDAVSDNFETLNKIVLPKPQEGIYHGV